MKEQIHFSENDFIWEGIDRIDYKPAEGGGSNSFLDVFRQNLMVHDEEIDFDIRYFECGPGGFSTLEKHKHVHAVIIVRGAGKVIIGNTVISPKPFDLIKIPSWTAHQLVNTGDEPFGFFCTVNGIRDKFTLLSRLEIEELKQDPELKTAIRVPEEYFN